MNTFVVQNLSSDKGRRFHNNPPVKYPLFLKNGCVLSIGRNNIQRCPYHHTVGPYGVLLTQNTKPLPANYPQCAHRQVALYSGFNVTNRNFSYPINVLSGKVNGLYGPLRQNQTVIALTSKMLPPQTKQQFQGNNFTKPPLATSNTNHKRLLDVFHKNFNLSRPAVHVHDVHDRKRKQMVLGDDAVAQNRRYLLNGNSNKRPKPMYNPQSETNKLAAANNPNAVKKNKDQVRYRAVIEEDKNGLLRVCYELLSGSKENVGSTRAGGSNNSASLVANNAPTDLDLTLHL